VIAEEQLRELLAGGVDRESNMISVLVETVTRLVVQQLLEAEQADYLGGRGRYERRGDGQVGSRNGYEPGRIRTAEGGVEVAVPQVRGAGTPFRSSLMSFLDGNSEVLDRLVTEMYARGLSTRDVEDAFRDATGELLISKSAVSEITDRLWEDYQAFIARDLSEIEVEYLFADAVSSRYAGTARKRHCWSPGASTPTAASTYCIWPWATRSLSSVGPASSATCSSAACGPRPRSPPTARPD
jgi:transposase-like protein